MSRGAFTLATDRHEADQLRVVKLRGTEALSEVYRFEIDLACALGMGGLAAVEPELLGRPASLGIHHDSEPSRFSHGVITEVEVLEPLAEERVHVRVVLQPRLALLDLRTSSRVFQGKNVIEIAEAVMAEWGVPVRNELKLAHKPRTYCTQYRETDLAFVKRILAQEGIAFFFDPGADPGDAHGSETVVLIDGAWFYPPIPGEPGLRYHVSEHHEATEIKSFSVGRRLRPRATLLADFDHRKPQLALRASAEMDALPSSPPKPTEGLQAYLFRDRPELELMDGHSELSDEIAQTRLEQLRSDAHWGQGEGQTRRLLVGHVFQLSGHPVDGLDADYVITRIEHEGTLPEHTQGVALLYTNRFQCAPADQHIRPALPPRRLHQVVETATVVGPDSEEVHTDDKGRIKVQFHWDRDGEHNEQSGCWLRVSQTWAGTGWGAQWLPRVGVEVLVSFLGGDPDRPIVTGCVYNATHPTPFQLPDDSSKSGFRSKTIGGDGFNELSFEDRQGAEQIYLHAERDLVTDVLGEHRLDVEGSQRVTVVGARTESYGGGLSSTVHGQSSARVNGDHSVSITGASAQAVDGSIDLRVAGTMSQRVVGAVSNVYEAPVTSEAEQDVTAKVKGHMTAVVGEHDARKSLTLHVEGATASYSSGAAEIVSEKRLTLICGDSRLVLSPEGIELDAPQLRIGSEAVQLLAKNTVALEAPEQITLKSDKILAQSEEAFLGLAKIAKLKGKLVKLNCEDDPVDELEPPEPEEPTIIELKSEEGEPLAKRRFVLVLPDGSEIGGTTDEEGKCELVVEESGDIIFTDVDEPRSG